MLLSVVNMKLRDEYEDLDDFCASQGIAKSDLESRLESVGFSYDPATRQFR